MSVSKPAITSAFLIIALFLMVSAPLTLYASDLIEGRITAIDPDRNMVTIFDFFDQTEKEVAVPDTKGIEKDTLVKMLVERDKSGNLHSERIQSKKGLDATGMKRRLRKVIRSMSGKGGKGHRGHRCRCW